MIETFTAPRMLQGSSRTEPMVLAIKRAVLGCGCSGFVGKRLDTMGDVTVLRPCSQEHVGMIEHVRLAVIAAYANPPLPMPALELINSLLVEASRARTAAKPRG